MDHVCWGEMCPYFRVLGYIPCRRGNAYPGHEVTLAELYGVYACEKAGKSLIFKIDNAKIKSSCYIQQQWLITLQER